MKYNKIINFLLFALCMYSCMNDQAYTDSKKLSIPVSDILNENYVLISNEGNFMYGNSSLSYYNTYTHELINNVFYKQNKLPLGDVFQSLVIRDGLAYAVINNSGKIFVFNMGKYPTLSAFAYVGKINGLVSPRYIHFLSDTKAYVTDMYAKRINIINPASLNKIGFISVDNKCKKFAQHSTEQMVQYKQYVFVSCWSYDNMILVIDSEKDQVVDSIQVGLQPNNLIIDKNNKIWTISDGSYKGSAYGSERPCLWKIDAATRQVENKYFLDKENSASELKLNSNKDSLFYINKHVYKMNVNDDILPSKEFISGNDKLFYGLNIDSRNSDIYVFDAIDYVQPGLAYRFSVSGVCIDTLRVGIIPGEAVFN